MTPVNGNVNIINKQGALRCYLHAQPHLYYEARMGITRSIGGKFSHHIGTPNMLEGLRHMPDCPPIRPSQPTDNTTISGYASMGRRRARRVFKTRWS